MPKENLKDIQIFFKVVVPQTYEEFSGLFPGVFDELENPDHVWGNMGLRSISVDFRRIRKSMGLVGKRRKLFNEWMTRYLDEHRSYWNLYGGTCKAYYAEDENFEYGERRWILIGRRHLSNSENIDPNEHKIDVTY